MPISVRPFSESDGPWLQQIAGANGFPYPDLADALIESILIVCDESGQPIMALAAKRLVELYCWCDQSLTPHEKVAGLRALHESMADALRTKGYNEAEAFLPPSVSVKFGRRLMKTFGWVKNWDSWCRRF